MLFCGQSVLLAQTWWATYVAYTAICSEYSGSYFKVGKQAPAVADAGQPFTYTLLLTNISPVT